MQRVRNDGLLVEELLRIAAETQELGFSETADAMRILAHGLASSTMPSFATSHATRETVVHD